MKFAQVVGVFPGPKFDDAEGAEGVEEGPSGGCWGLVLGWEKEVFGEVYEVT